MGAAFLRNGLDGGNRFARPKIAISKPRPWIERVGVRNPFGYGPRLPMNLRILGLGSDLTNLPDRSSCFAYVCRKRLGQLLGGGEKPLFFCLIRLVSKTRTPPD